MIKHCKQIIKLKTSFSIFCFVSQSRKFSEWVRQPRPVCLTFDFFLLTRYFIDRAVLVFFFYSFLFFIFWSLSGERGVGGEEMRRRVNIDRGNEMNGVE